MRKGIQNFLVLAILSLGLLLSPFSSFLFAGENAKGNIIGFVYDKDGTTPLGGATVKFKNLTSGTLYESTKSDDYGIFKVIGVESGIYTYGVVTEKGDFNADNIVGLKVGENETAKLSIALNPYDKDVAEAISEIYKEQEMKGESLVGTIADFNPTTRMAQIQVVKGLLQVKDRIHTKGRATDFYQSVSVMKLGNSSARRLMKGQTGSVHLERQAAKGDLVFVVPYQNIFPFFLAPVGYAAVIAGNAAVNYGIVIIPHGTTPVSPKKN